MTWYVRGALSWKAGDALEFTLSYQHQTDQSDGFSQTRPGFRYAQTLYLDQPGSFKTDLASLDGSYDMGFATLSSSSSSFTKQGADSQYDLTGLIESLASLYGNYPRTLSPIEVQTDDKAFTDAVTCPFPTFGEVIQYYQGGIRPSLNPDPDLNFPFNRHVSFSDVAAFNETSYHFTDQWQVTGGARIFWQHYAQELEQTLPMCGPFCSQSGTDPSGLTAASNAKGFRNQIFKVNTSYQIAALAGVSGDRLPGVSRQQGTLAWDYLMPLSNNDDFHARIDASYRSDFWISLPHSPSAADLPGFTIMNARVGLGIAKTWRIDAFVNNITNQQAATTVSTVPSLDHNRAEYVGRPRTAGLELHYSFKGR